MGICFLRQGLLAYWVLPKNLCFGAHTSSGVWLFSRLFRMRSPLVYEDMFSKIRTSVLLGLFRVIFVLHWCFVTGPRSLPYLHVLRAKTRLEASKGVFGTHDNTLGPSTLMLGFTFGMYWLNLIAFVQPHFVNVDGVKWFYEFTIHSICKCSICFVWIIAQHCYVLGLCLWHLNCITWCLDMPIKGLAHKKEWHRRMLGYAHEGLGDCRDFEPFLAMSCFTLLRLILRTLIVHIEGFIIAADPETSHPLFYRTAQSGCETICLALCLEMCNLPKIHLKFL